MSITFDRLDAFFSNRLQGTRVAAYWSRTIRYLNGTLPLKNLCIRQENAALYLKIAKLIDLTAKSMGMQHKPITFQHSTFRIRERILEVDASRQTTEVFT